SINETDLIDYLGRDKETKVICLYVEGIKNGRKFMRVCKKVSKKKPIIAIKGGITEAGSRATLSHTASLAGNAEIYKAAFKQAGIIWADSLEDLFDYARVLEKCVEPKGRRVQIITNGGGYGILSADALELNNLKLASMSEKTREFLKKQFPNLVIVNNPIDLVGDADTGRYRTSINASLDDQNIDILLVVVLYQTPLITSDIVDVIKEAHDSKKKPIFIVSTGGDFTEIHKRSLEEHGVPCFTFPDRAAKAIRTLCNYYLGN
ncbi:MAG: CoA-binding protein, partial [Nanoarchaeota archaeon]